MRRLLLIALLASFAAADNAHVMQIGKQIEGLKESVLPEKLPYRPYDPFRAAAPAKTAPNAAAKGETALRLETVMNGKAYMRGRWVSPGERIGAYRLERVETDAVVVTGPDGESRRLTIAKPRTLIRTKDTNQ